MSVASKLNRYVNEELVLLCEIPISDDEFDELSDYAYAKMINRKSWDTHGTDLLLSVFLVQTAIRKYSAGFWDKVFETVKLPQRIEIQISFGKIFLQTIRQYGLFELQNNSDHNLYVENIKAHAFIPNEYMKGYYDFLYSFYNYNLLNQLGDDLDQDIDDMIRYLSDTLHGKDKSEDDYRTKVSSYHLLNATKYVLAEAESGYVHNLISKNLHMIDDFYYEGTIIEEGNRFSNGFLRWSEDYIKDLRKAGIQKIRHARDDVRSRTPVLMFDSFSYQPFIIIRMQKIRERDYVGTAKAIIQGNGEYYEIDLDPYYSAGVYLTDDKTIEVNNILGSYTIDIVSGPNNKIRTYEIKHDSYIMFDKNCLQITEIKNWDNLHLFVSKTSKVTFENIELSYSVDTDLSGDWDHYAFEKIQHDSVISVNGQYIQPKNHLDEMVKCNPMSVMKCRVYYQGQLISCDIAHPLITFTLLNDVIDSSFLVIESAGDEFRFDLKNNIFQKVPKGERKTLCGIWIDELMEVIPGRYTVKLYEAGIDPRVIADYVLLPKLSIQTDKDFYELDSQSKISIRTELDLNPLNCSKNGDTYILKFDDSIPAARFEFELDDEQYILEVPVLAISFSYNGTWYYSANRTVWVDDIWNQLYVRIPGAVRASIYVASKEKVPYFINGEIGKNNIYKFSKKELQKELSKSISVRNKIFLHYCDTDNEWRTIQLFSILERVIVNDVQLYTEDGQIIKLLVKHEGKNYIRATIRRRNDNQALTEVLIVQDEAEVVGLSEKDSYDIDLYEESRNDGHIIEKIQTETNVPLIYKNDTRDLNIRIKLIHNGKRTLYPIYHVILTNFRQYGGKYLCDLEQRKSTYSKKYIDIIRDLTVEMDFTGHFATVVNLYIDSGDEADFLYFDMKNRMIVSGDSELVKSARDYNRFEMIDLLDNTRIDCDILE